MLKQHLTHLAVAGAAGKMGSGIALLLLQALTRKALAEGPQGLSITFLDRSDQALEGLQSYLKAQMTKYAEKALPKLVGLKPGSPEAQIAQVVDQAFALAKFTTKLTDLAPAHLVFEAIFEKLEIKDELLSQLKKICAPGTYYFSNTSSIPISAIDQKVGLEGHILGYHFYNPPAVQKLLEIITATNTKPELVKIGHELGQELGKVMVPSHDVAGFIGNGHFIRDGLYGLGEAERLAQEMSFPEALYCINRVTQDFMIRPMGIFQLIDYVGLDVFQMILATMDRYIEGEGLHSGLIDEMMSQGVKGGQNHDGSQKDGFLKYEGGKPVAVYCPKQKHYSPMSGDWKAGCDQKLGQLPHGHQPWKVLVKAEDRNHQLAHYFGHLFEEKAWGARLAAAYLKNSRRISQNLVKDQVAEKAEDVTAVLMNGFFHLYGPENDLF